MLINLLKLKDVKQVAYKSEAYKDQAGDAPKFAK
jgi:hypothetical protein